MKRKGPIILIRADGAFKLGGGHIFRCLHLARILKKTGFRIYWAAKDIDPRMNAVILQNGFRLFKLPRLEGVSCKSLKIKEIIRQLNPACVIADLSNPEMLHNPAGYIDYLKAIKSTGTYLACFDGLFHDAVSRSQKNPADLVLIPYFGAHPRFYRGESSTRFLLGPKYFVVAPEYAHASRTNVVPTKKPIVTVSLGGSDTLEFSAKLSAWLLEIARTPLFIQVVIGPSFSSPTIKRLEKLCRSYPSRIKLYRQPPVKKIISLIKKSLCVITAGGLTKYEVALLGIPCLMISLDKNHAVLNGIFSTHTGAVHLGEALKLKKAIVQNTITRLIQTPALRQKMKRRHQSFLDAQGGHRISRYLKRELSREN